MNPSLITQLIADAQAFAALEVALFSTPQFQAVLADIAAIQAAQNPVNPTPVPVPAPNTAAALIASQAVAAAAHAAAKSA